MSQEHWSAVDEYLASLLVPTDPVLEAVLADSAAAGLPPIHVSAVEGKLLMLLALAMGARNILEIGTLGGYSTIWLARALPPGGRLVTLEAEEKHARVARSNLAKAKLHSQVDVRLGQALETLPGLVEERRGPFDLIFIDADKPSYPEYLTWSLKLSRPATLIIADNVVRNGKVIEAASSDPQVQGVRRFLGQVAKDKRLQATAIQTVGMKGYDGFVLARVTSL